MTRTAPDLVSPERPALFLTEPGGGARLLGARGRAAMLELHRLRELRDVAAPR